MSTEVNRATLEGLFGNAELRLSAQEEYDIRTDDYVMEMPQSGERISGRDKMRAFQEAYPNPPSMKLLRILGVDDIFVLEAVSDYGTEVSNVVNIIEFKDAKIIRETRYYATPFPAPEWRSQWVETIPKK